MTFKEPEDEEFDRIMEEQIRREKKSEVPRAGNIQRLNRQQVLDVWNTIYPEGSIIDSDNFIYEFADAIQTYLGIGEKHGT